jgi:hypothetical protein
MSDAVGRLEFEEAGPEQSRVPCAFTVDQRLLYRMGALLPGAMTSVVKGQWADLDPDLQAGAYFRPVRVRGENLLGSCHPLPVAMAVGQQTPYLGR